MGPLAASTQAHERHGHPGRMIHGFSSKKSREPSGLVERTRELYDLAIENLELVTNWPKPDPHEWDVGAPLGLAR